MSMGRASGYICILHSLTVYHDCHNNIRLFNSD